MLKCWRLRSSLAASALVAVAVLSVMAMAQDDFDRRVQADPGVVFSSAGNCSACMRMVNSVWCTEVGNAVCMAAGDPCNEEVMDLKSSFSAISEELPSTSNQFSPQHVRVKLRGDITIPVYFHQIEKYPVDLYFLSDGSESMKNDLKTTQRLGDSLQNAMSQLSNTARFGCGVFIDKPVPPYFTTYYPPGFESDSLSFYNALRLTDDIEQFKTAIGKIRTTGNLDSPEGGFDALAQVVSCDREIGWSTDSLKLVVFVSDARPHIAGDGKLAGIVKPNDGACHLENEAYTKSTEQDYPSISQINYMVKEKNINVLFAVPQRHLAHYRAISERIDSSSVHELADSSTNVVEVVTLQYKNIRKTLKLTYTESEYVHLTFYTNCTGTLEKTGNCVNVADNDIVHFEIHVKRKRCPPVGHSMKEQIVVSAAGRSDTITLDIEHQCDCPCDKPTTINKDAACNDQGQLLCGKCSCDTGFIGKKCECKEESYNLNDTSNCMRPNDKVPCSGSGSCRCNQCDCQEGHSGQFCECSSISCDRFGNQFCGGHGSCVCGNCECEAGWTGTNCDCPTSKDNCIDPVTGLECSGHGRCDCGKCKCESNDDARYTGNYCEYCANCNAHCSDYEECVECVAFETGPLHENGKCNETCKDMNITVVDEIEENDIQSKQCNVNDDANCRIKFRVIQERGKVFISVKKDKICPPPINILNIVLTLIAAIVVVGMAILMLWKLLTVIHDRREYAKWDSERKAAKWDTGENPIYKQATSTFKNPAYGR